MSKLWEKRKPPTPIDYEALLQINGTEENGHAQTNCAISTQRIWSKTECLEHFCQAVNALKIKLNENDLLVWDKVS